jgi:cytochrome P450
MDLIRDLAYPLPATVIMELLGVPGEDRDRLKTWTAERIAFLGSVTVAPDPLAVARHARHSAAALGAYFSGLVAERRARPTDDLLSALVAVEAVGDDHLSEAELVANAMLLLSGGHETTMNLIGNGMLALLRHPEQLRLLRGDATRIPTAVEELLRYDSPVQFAPRAAATDIDIGVTHRRGRAGDAGTWGGEPRSEPVCRPRPARRYAPAQRAHGLRFRPSLLSGRTPGPHRRPGGRRDPGGTLP